MDCVFSPELRLLAACSYYDQGRWPEQQRHVLEALAAHPGREEFLALVDRHRLHALAEFVLARAGRPMEELAAPARRIRLQMLGLHAEWLRLRDRFAQAGIPLLALKGTTLSASLYGDPALRHSKDIDLLTTPAALGAAHRVLTEDGYAMPARAQWHLEGYSPTRRATVELHWHVERFPGSSLDGCWMEWFRAGGRAAHYELLHLCMHGSEHFWTRLKWLGDVRVLFGRLRPEDWPDLLELSRRLRLDSIVGEALLLVDRVYGLAPLNTVRPDDTARALAAESLGCLVSPVAAFEDGSGRRWLRRLRREVRLRGRLPVTAHAARLVRMLGQPPARGTEHPTNSAPRQPAGISYGS